MKTQPARSAAPAPAARTETRSRRGYRYAPLVLLPILVLVVFGVGMSSSVDAEPVTPAPVFPQQPVVPEVAAPETVCASGGAAQRRAALILDLRKPVSAAHLHRPGEVLLDVTRRERAGTEIAVYALSAYAEAPRTLLGRLCKPYDNDELVVATTKDGSGATGDCDDLPARVAARVRTGAAEFCAARAALRSRIDALAQRAPTFASDAYLVEALDAVRRDFAADTTPTSVYVFSDMMQHAPWFSHIDLGPERWDYDAFAEARAAELAASGRSEHPPDGLAVRVFYVVRAGTTEIESARAAHQAFWRRHLEGAEVAFEDGPTMPAYPAERLVDVPTPAELAAYEMEKARHQAVIVERERDALAQDRQDLERERQRLAERERRIAETERRLAEREESLAAAENTLADMAAADAPGTIVDAIAAGSGNAGP